MESERLGIGTRQNVTVTETKNALKVLTSTQTLSFKEEKLKFTFRKGWTSSLQTLALENWCFQSL